MGARHPLSDQNSARLLILCSDSETLVRETNLDLLLLAIFSPILLRL